jgi:hypothetical protein
MNPKYTPVVLFGVTSVLMAPYFMFVIHYSRKFPSGQWPLWITNTILIWFVANFLAVLFLVRMLQKKFKPTIVDAEKARVISEKARRTSTRLLILWVAFFVYGAVKTLQGAFPLQRAIPAGAFLLFFIGLFGGGIYREKRGKKPEPTSLT